ncbi:hypothetical protein BH23CHL7_BH23CHL7_02300 [soil metagenome]
MSAIAAALPRPVAVLATHRLTRLALVAAAAAWTGTWWFYATASGHHSDLTWWGANMANLYAGGLATDGFYGYSPAFVQLLTPLRLLPWEAVVWAWAALMLGGLALSAGRLTPLVILAPPVLGELIIGNVHLLYAGAIVLGFRWPAAWALMLLTKVTPGIGLLWFAVRREWRSLGLALGASALIAAISYAVAPGLWAEWLATLGMSAQAAPLPIQPNALFPVPLLVRLPLAAAIVAWGALTDRRWTVAVAVTLALPVVWTAGLSVLVAALPFIGRRKVAARPPQPAPAAG